MKNTIVSKEIAKLKELRVNKSSAMFLFAKELYEVNKMINWRHTIYKSFANMCEKELQMTGHNGHNLIYNYKNIRKFNYTIKELNQLLGAFSFSKLSIICMYTSRKTAVNTLIKKYSKMSVDAIKAMHSVSSRNEETAFLVSLPEPYAIKWESILMAHGMSKPTRANSRRKGVREAYMNLIDTL